jgi:hypothetical protein
MVQRLYRGPFTKKAAFTNQDSHPLLLDLIMIKEFGSQYLEWEPETCWQEVKLTLGTTVSEVNKNKIQAVRSCHVTESPYEEWHIFEKIALGLNSLIPKFDVIQKINPHICAVTFESMGHIKSSELSEEVLKYVASVLLEDGVIFGPGPLKPCNEFIRKFVSSEKQARVEKLVKENKTPTFDGVDDTDVQVAKSRSILDYVEYDSKQLLQQLEKVLRDK